MIFFASLHFRVQGKKTFYTLQHFLVYRLTVCPRSSEPFYIVSYYNIKWVTTSRTYSTYLLTDKRLNTDAETLPYVHLQLHGMNIHTEVFCSKVNFTRQSLTCKFVLGLYFRVNNPKHIGVKYSSVFFVGGYIQPCLLLSCL